MSDCLRLPTRSYGRRASLEALNKLEDRGYLEPMGFYSLAMDDDVSKRDPPAAARALQSLTR